jgi:carbamoylphosphate synthase large subunit
MSPKPFTILLTGIRAPASLDLARKFSEAGYRVIAADSSSSPIARHSNAFSRFYSLPSPNSSAIHFQNSLVEIILKEGIDLLIPICEEALHVSVCKEVLEKHCSVFVDDLKKMIQLHHKFQFNQLCLQLGFDVPASTLLANPSNFAATLEKISSEHVVLKPAFSRFASETKIISKDAVSQAFASTLAISEVTPWLVQEFIYGKEFCAYATAQDGKILSQVTYDHEFTAGLGSGVCFASIDHPVIKSWVHRFVQQMNYTGQIAFDFIENKEGKIFALECNPRGTSGIHLLSRSKVFISQFKNLKQSVPFDLEAGVGAQLSLAMVVYGLPSVRSPAAFSRWTKIFFSFRDVIFSWKDLNPVFYQFISFFNLLRLAKKNRVSALTASTLDIEWSEIHS